MKTENKDSYLKFLFGKQGLAVWTMCLGVGLHAVNWNIVSTIAPSMVYELGNVKLISWLTIIYLATSVIFGSYAGYIKRQIGARTALLVFAVIFAIGSFTVSVASNMSTVFLGRALQGIGEGVILSLSYGVSQDIFSHKATPKLFGLFAFVYAFSAAVGPILAGFLTDSFSWRVALAANIAFAGLYIIMLLRSIPNQKFHDGRMKATVPFFRLALVGMAILLIGLMINIKSGLLVSLLITASFSLFFFCFKIDHKEENKIFPSKIFWLTSTLGIGFWVIFLLPFSLSGIAIFLPLYAQTVFGISVTSAGYLSTIISFAWSFSAFTTGKFKTEKMAYLLILLGAFGQFLGSVIFFFGTYFDLFWIIVLGLLVTGGSLGCCWAFVTQKIIESTNKGEEDLAASQVPVVHTIAIAVGAGFVGALANMNGLSEEIASPVFLKTALLPVFGACLITSSIGAAFGLWLVWSKKKPYRPYRK